MGYAYKGTNSHKRLVRSQSPDAVQIDYSFNEPIHSIDRILVEEGCEIRAYSAVDMIAEKLRALLQQEVRNRARRQDAFDIFHLLDTIRQGDDNDDFATKAKVLPALLKKAKARNLYIDQSSMADENIIRRSRQEYSTLAAEIEGDLPAFDEVYSRVREFYESLPWDTLSFLTEN